MDLRIPYLSEIVEQLEVRGDQLQESVDLLLESLATVNASIVELTEVIRNQKESG